MIRGGGLTYERVEEKGRPLSRAKDQSCRDAVATSLMVLDVRVTIRTVTMTFVAL